MHYHVKTEGFYGCSGGETAGLPVVTAQHLNELRYSYVNPSLDSCAYRHASLKHAPEVLLDQGLIINKGYWRELGLLSRITATENPAFYSLWKRCWMSYMSILSRIQQASQKDRANPTTAGEVVDGAAPPHQNLVSELTGSRRNRVYAYCAYIILN